MEAPCPAEMRTPPASEDAPEGTPQPAGGRLRFLNGCVPLSHQVAGHMYGKDKVANKHQIKQAVKKLCNIDVAKASTLIRPDAEKKAYVQLAPDYDALDVANKLGII
ncbi:Inositol polyphosphate multikinase [Tupaia chinensis]|uniref:Inositol polyphosphate multikinase n=1 Tax=Tupaia chinensis TaxID=246437 RepID=L9KWX2_TUPCH|nr:Inositol polyphosphate multikinase [Tupaia chinensis]